MNQLLNCYKDRITSLDGSVFDVFKKFYGSELPEIDGYLKKTFESKVRKNDELSKVLRTKGNSFFASGKNDEAVYTYSKALCVAEPKKEQYAVALANRSAVLFKMGDFKDCLEDIARCFDAEYPDTLKPKIYLRKALCYHALLDKQKEAETLDEFVTFLNSSENLSAHDKEKYLREVELFTKKVHDIPKSDKSDPDLQLPDLAGGENPIFANASDKIKLSYNKEKGRHVVAKTKIDVGEVLFVEKAFVFAPVFKKSKDLDLLICFHCLAEISILVPCHTCTKCVYCDEQCRISSWEEGHRWECAGMQTDLWNDLGLAFPAFRALLKGVKAGYNQPNVSYDDDVKRFGDKDDNYPYFCKLLSNIIKKTNMAPFIVMSAVLIKYLEKFTNFFAFAYEASNCTKKSMEEFILFCGGLVTKHIGQICCNSSVIEYWAYTGFFTVFPNNHKTIASGTYPAVSMMNHSCKPNITTFFIKDTIIVKALEPFEEGQEILNCYGIDFRVMFSKHRKQACWNMFHFVCKCSPCTDPLKEFDVLDSYLCPKCKGRIPDIKGESNKACIDCNTSYMLKEFREANNKIHKNLEQDDTTDEFLKKIIEESQLGDNFGNSNTKYHDVNPSDVKVLEKSLNLANSLLYPTHKDFLDIYYRLYKYYSFKMDKDRLFEYFSKWLEVEKIRRGEYSRIGGTKLFEAALGIMKSLENGHCSEEDRDIHVKRIETLLQQNKFIMDLYYPSHFTSPLTPQFEQIINKLKTPRD